MSKIAEEAALKAYPPSLEIYPQVPSATVVDFKPEVRDWNMLNRQRFMEGYEHAEEDMKERFIQFVHRHYPINYIGWIQDFQRAMEDEK